MSVGAAGMSARATSIFITFGGATRHGNSVEDEVGKAAPTGVSALQAPVPAPRPSSSPLVARRAMGNSIEEHVRSPDE